MISDNVSSQVLISVCIPVYNGDNYIRECMDSVLNQTEKNFELLVVNNCSTDQTANIVAEFDDPRIRVFVNKSKLDIVSNFNRCIELAKGEFIVLLPHDDMLLPTALEVFSKALVSYLDVGLVYSSYYVIDEKGKKLHFVGDAEDKVMTGGEAFKRLIEGCPIQCAMVRRKVYSRTGLWDTSIMFVDWEMWCRIALAGYKFAYFKDPQNCYRVHSKNTHKFLIRDNLYYPGIFKGIKKVFDNISPQSDFQKLRQKSVNWIIGPQVKNLGVSLIHLRWKHIKENLSLIIKIMVWAGYFRSFPTFLISKLRLMKWYAGRLLKGIPK